MKRAIAFVTALVVTAGAVAPAVSVFGADLPAIPQNSDPVSIWDTNSSTPANPYNTQDLFDWCCDAWGDLFDDGRLNNYTVQDYQRDSVGWMVSKYVAAHEDEVVEGITTSYFDDIVDYVCAHPTDFDLYWNFAVNTWWMTGNIYGDITAGENFYDNLKDYVLTNYYSTPSADFVTIGSGQWVKGRCVVYLRSSYAYDVFSVDYGVSSIDEVYFTQCSNGGVIACAVSTGPVRLRFYYNYVTGGTNTEYIDMGYAYDGSLSSGYYLGSPAWNSAYISGLSAQYTDKAAACADFYGYSPVVDSEPVSNGKVYLRDVPIGGDNVNFSFPAAPVSNSKAVSNYYYNTYGDEWEDNSTVINESVYNNNTTTLYPVTYENNIPVWLVQGSTTIETFDYSLELPSAPLETLPSEFEGGGSFFQNSFVVLGGFGAFVLVGLSFSLVGLFFKE